MGEIENDDQRRITEEWRDRFKDSLDGAKQPAGQPDWVFKASCEAVEAQIGDLEAEMATYDAGQPPKCSCADAMETSNCPVHSIKCPQCGMTSFNPNDICEKYCGNCNQYHDTMRRTP